MAAATTHAIIASSFFKLIGVAGLATLAALTVVVDTGCAVVVVASVVVLVLLVLLLVGVVVVVVLLVVVVPTGATATAGQIAMLIVCSMGIQLRFSSLT